MIHSVIVDIKQGIFSYRFIISCLTLLFMMLSAMGVLEGYDTPPCTILRMFLTTDNQLWMQSTAYSSYQVWVRGLTANQIGVFLPAIISFPMIPILCDELNSQNYRFHCVRNTFRVYCLSKCIATFLVAGCIVLTATALFGCICMSILPPLSAYANSEEVLYSGVDITMPWQELIQRIVFLLGFAATDAIICIYIASVTAEKFQSITLPVVLFFLMNQISQKLYVRENDIRYFILSPDYQYQPFEWFSAIFPNASIWLVLLFPITICSVGTLLTLQLLKRRLRR